jgi:hypothetical protein
MKNFSAIKDIISLLENGIANGTLKSTKTLNLSLYISGFLSFLMVFGAFPAIQYIDPFFSIFILLCTGFIVYYYVCIMMAVQYQRTTRLIKEIISNNDLNESDFDFIFIKQENKNELREHLKNCKNKLVYKYNINKNY